jgi:hypothetical protein
MTIWRAKTAIFWAILVTGQELASQIMERYSGARRAQQNKAFSSAPACPKKLR